MVDPTFHMGVQNFDGGAVEHVNGLTGKGKVQGFATKKEKRECRIRKS